MTLYAPQVSTLEVKLKEKCKVDYQVKIFPGQTHGFVYRKQEDSFLCCLYFPSGDVLIVSWNLNKTLESGNLK